MATKTTAHSTGLKKFSLKKSGRFALPNGKRKVDSTVLEPYDWGTKGRPQGKPLTFVVGKGWVIGE